MQHSGVYLRTVFILICYHEQHSQLFERSLQLALSANQLIERKVNRPDLNMHVNTLDHIQHAKHTLEPAT